MNKQIGPMELFLNRVARILMFLVAVGITAFVGNYVLVIALGEPISEPRTDTTSQEVGSLESVTPPTPGPDAAPADTASPPIDTIGSTD